MIATPRPSLALLLFVPSLALAQTAATYDGGARQTTVRAPRLTAEIRVDGVLDEPAWTQAARLSGFNEYRPVDGRPAEDSTVVLVFYSPGAIHFGIRAYEAHGNVVRATLADRDNIGADDRIELLLDTYDDKRRALLFAVNPLGVQQDGVQSEGFDPSQSAGGRFDGIVDISPDFNFDSRGHVTPWGYEVEVRIPFKSLRYQSADPQSWGLQIKRITQHSGHEDTWTPAVRANASFLVQSGQLTGLTGLHRGLVLEMDPEFTSSMAGTPGPGDRWDYSNPTAEIGGNVRWGVTPNYTVNATVNPDFSQVESDVGQVTVNERFALFFPEKRPFFLDGLEQYDTPNRLIYTRQINAPLGGIKLTGKSGGTAIAYLGAADDRRYSDGGDVPVFNLLRVRKDIGTSSTIGAVHTDRIDGNDYNRVSGADARVIWRKIWYSQAQVAGAWTRDALGSRNGALWDVTFADRTGRAYGNHFELAGISDDFETRSGFVPRNGIVTGSAANRFSWYGKPGTRVEQLTTFIVASPVWRYDEFPDRSTFEGSFSQFIAANIRGGWVVRGNIVNTHQRFDSLTYLDYRIAGPVDTTAFRRPHGQYGLWSTTIGMSTPNRALSFSADAGYGETVIFAEAARGRFTSATVSSSWHPNASLRVEGSLVHQRITREESGTRFSTATIPRIKTEYQLTRAIFLRYIGQYVAQDRSALIDARTGLPLIIVSAGTPFGPASAVVFNDFRNDFLFSYKPTPGTVFFFGYGASLTEPSAFAFQTSSLRRVSDGFFLKASYRYRL